MRKILNVNRKWAFSKKESEVPTEMPKDWCFVNLPHTWNDIDGQDGGTDYYRGRCFYVKELEFTDLPEGEVYFLEVLGANSKADVYLNGKELFHHEGGYSAWRVNITDALRHGKNILAIAVDNSDDAAVYPRMADFTFYGGLYRGVNIIAVSRSHFSLDYFGGPGIAVTSEVVRGDARVDVEVFVSEKKDNQKIRYTILNRDKKEIVSSVSSDTRTSLFIEDAVLWNAKKNAYLYTLKAELLSQNKVIDEIQTKFGCRSISVDAERGFILNGEEYALRGVSRHQDRWGVGNALLREHHTEDMDLIEEIGATTVRLAHYQHDQYFYDLCDERGIVVWAEIPYISKHSPAGLENTISQMKELIVQCYNHPSIVCWGLSNEITMTEGNDESLIENHKVLNALCHEMDKTRFTTVAAVSPCPIDNPYLKIPDAVSYNHYFGWYGGDVSMNGPWFDKFHETYPNIPIGCSEYGCEALDWHTSEPVQGDYTEEYQAYYHEELIKQLFSRKYLWATHVWNMFDFGADARNEGGENGQNHKGLVTFDRKYKKDAFYAYKAWLSDEPFVHICGKRYVERAEDLTRIKVYSNLPEVELFANGVSLGKKKADDHFFSFDVENRATTVLVAIAGERRDESVIKKVDRFNENYRLREKSAVLNWFDISEVEGCFSLNDKISDIMATEIGEKIIKETFSSLAKSETDLPLGIEINDSMMQMMGGFTFIRLAGMLGMMGVNLNKEDLLSINAKLNKVKKA